MTLGCSIFIFLTNKTPRIVEFAKVPIPMFSDYACTQCEEKNSIPVNWSRHVGGTLIVYCRQCGQPYLITGVK